MPFLRCIDPIQQTTKEIALRKPLVTIGRQSGNDIVLEDATIAPTHATFTRKGGNYDVHVSKRGLELYLNGKLIKRGLFKGRRPALDRAIRTHIGRRQPCHNDGRVAGAGHTDTLSQLVEFSSALMREETPERLFSRLLEAVVSVSRAEKGFVIVLKDGERHMAAHHNVGAETLDLSRVSDTILDQVIEHRRPVIVSDALNDRKFRKARSVVDLKLSSVMCVPLIYRNDLLGVLYLGNDAITGLFTEKDLSIVRIWASQASMVVHTALMLNELKVTNRNLRERLRQSGQGSIIGSCAPMKSGISDHTKSRADRPECSGIGRNGHWKGTGGQRCSPAQRP